MSRYPAMFAALKERGEGAFVPFVMVGDPDPDTSEAVIEALIAGGADALELGVPFTDPVADGPTIQRAHVRALAAGAGFRDCLEVVARVRRRHPRLPIGMLIYGNVPFAMGLERFYSQCAQAGIDSVLLPGRLQPGRRGRRCRRRLHRPSVGRRRDPGRGGGSLTRLCLCRLPGGRHRHRTGLLHRGAC